MPTFLSQRKINLMAFLICSFALSFALWLEYGYKLNPCPLCIMQRVALIGLGLSFGIGILISHSRRWASHTQHVIALFFGILGSLLAGRQVWLQHLPADRIPGCGPSLNYMLKHLPAQETLRFLFWGSGDCATVQWRWLGLSIPEWSLILFLILTIVAIVSLTQGRRQAS